MPDLENTMTMGITATMAQHERELISQRTKDGLKVARAKGKQIGRLKGYKRQEWITDKVKEGKLRKARARNERTLNAIRHFQNKGLNNNNIAKELNLLGFVASRGGMLTAKQITRIINLY